MKLRQSRQIAGWHSINYLKKLKTNSIIFFELHPEKYDKTKKHNFDATVETLIVSGFNNFNVVSSGKEISEVFKRLNLMPTKSYVEQKWKRYLLGKDQLRFSPMGTYQRGLN